MNPVIDIIGIGADGPAGLRPESLARIQGAEFLAGGDRHLRFFPGAQGHRFVIKDSLADLHDQLSKRYLQQRCVVLASGDPLFYGIGNYLSTALGPEVLRIEPALSSMQLAFARAGVSWQDATLASIHGRNVQTVLLPLLGKRRLGLFTQDGESPAVVAQFFLERGLKDYEAVVGENLGTNEEAVHRVPNLDELARSHFAPLNYLILQRTCSLADWLELERYRCLAPGIPDYAFVRPAAGRAVMTRQEVRAVVLAKLLAEADPGDIAWDIGAGLGTVAVEIAILRPQMEVLAVEAKPERVALLRKNRDRFGAYNIRVVEGKAPDCLQRERDRPSIVFLGGSGSRLSSILYLASHRLEESGRLVATFVTLEHLHLAMARLQDWNWPFEVTEVQVARSAPLAGLTALKPQRGVFVVAATKPEGAHA